MENWLNIVSAESDEVTFKFVHHSTSSTIQLLKIEKDSNIISEFWMDYYEFQELIEFLNKLCGKIL